MGIVYLDNASTTWVAPEVVESMLHCLGAEGCYGNPAATEHPIGQAAASKLSEARALVAQEFGCKTGEIIFTSGATESNNLAILGIAKAHGQNGGHFVTSLAEHKSVLEVYRRLEGDGFAVTYIRPNKDGVVTADQVRQALRKDTLLLSLMHTNNETGAQADLDAIAEVVAEAGVLFHVDAAQAAGKHPIDLDRYSIDLLAVSAHKFHGPKGSGCLAIRNRRQLRLTPLFYGGGQEEGIRPGTAATHQAVGLARALQLASIGMETHLAHVSSLKGRFTSRLRERCECVINSPTSSCSPYILNFSVPGLRGDALVRLVGSSVSLSTGSACTSLAVEPSYVLQAMGLTGDNLYGAVRVSFNRYLSEDDIDLAVSEIAEAVTKIKSI